jgi:carbamoyl-phosphate synthase large subunit
LYKANAGELLPLANSPKYLKQVEILVEKHHIDAIIPGTEIEGQALVTSAGRFGSIPIIANRRELYPLMMDKFAAHKALVEAGVPAIETVPVDQWSTVAEKYGFPVVIKPTRGTGGSRGLKIIANRREMNDALLSSDPSRGFCVQPYIGNGEEEYTVGVLTDKDGALIDSIVMKRKLSGLSLLDKVNVGGKSYEISTGYSQGFFIRDSEIQLFCEKLALKIRSCGPLNLQLRRWNDRIYVFEIHPRFSGTTPMRADVGFNEPDILLRNHLFNEKFQRLNYQQDVAAIRSFQHVIVPIKDLKKEP